MNLHQIEEAEYRDGPVLWDAGEGVCCAAYQLGACPHTEADEYDPYDDVYCGHGLPTGPCEECDHPAYIAYCEEMDRRANDYSRRYEYEGEEPF